MDRLLQKQTEDAAQAKLDAALDSIATKLSLTTQATALAAARKLNPHLDEKATLVLSATANLLEAAAAAIA